MKTIITFSLNLFLISVLFINATSYGQKSTLTGRTLSLTELKDLIGQNYSESDQAKAAKCPWIASANIFPINGCGSFVVQQTVNYVVGSTSITANVKVCCVCAICMPHVEAKVPANKKGDRASSVNIISSTSVKFDKYDIQVASGRYMVDADGNLINLKFIANEK